MVAFFHSPSKKIAQRGCTSVALNLAALKNETALAKVRGVVAESADLAAGAADAMKPPVIRDRQLNAKLLNDFICDYAILANFELRRDGMTSTGQCACRTTCSATLPMRRWPSPVRPCVEITMRSASALAALQISTDGGP